MPAPSCSSYLYAMEGVGGRMYVLLPKELFYECSTEAEKRAIFSDRRSYTAKRTIFLLYIDFLIAPYWDSSPVQAIAYSHVHIRNLF